MSRLGFCDFARSSPERFSNFHHTKAALVQRPKVNYGTNGAVFITAGDKYLYQR